MYFANGHDCLNWVSVVFLGTMGIVVAGCGNQAVDGDDSSALDESVVAEAEQALVTWGGHSYLFGASQTERDKAETVCLTNGMQLTSVTTASEDAFLLQEIRNRGGGRWWIGLHDKGTEGVYVWPSGESYGSYKHWAVGEPDNTFNQDCVYIQSNDSGRWSTGDCGITRPYICEGD